MTALCVAVLVLVADQAIKLLLPPLIGSSAVSLGPFGVVRIVSGRLWLRRLGAQCSAATTWFIWWGAAAPLISVGILLPASAPLVGLLLGASFSHAIESSIHGGITDYVCLRFWPAFNLADLALAAGAVGIFAQLIGITGVAIF
jgi:lipoprotein signal peptidase